MSHTFAESLAFQLSGTLGSAPRDVILFYGQRGEGLVRRIYPPFDVAATLDVSYVEELDPGQFAPGVELVSWWEVETEDGQRLATDKTSHIYADTTQKWQVLQGERCDYYWYGRDAKRSRELTATADATIERLAREVGVVVEDRVRIYAYESEADMAPALAGRSTSYDDRVLTLGVSVGNDTMLLLATHRDAPMTLAHELCHVVVGMATDNPYADLPRWLDEGLAMYAEGGLPEDNQIALDLAIVQDELLSIRSMSSYSGRPEEVDLFYGEAYSVVSYLLDTYGRESMRELFGVFAQGVRQERALMEVYGLTLDELDAGWRASLGLEPRSKPQEPRDALEVPTPGDELEGEGAASPASPRSACPLGLVGALPLGALAVWARRRASGSGTPA